MQEEDFKKAFGTQLEALRKARGLTQQQLAAQINYTDKAVSKWERGESVPDAYTMQTLAKTLGVSVAVLYGEQPQEKPRVPKQKLRRLLAIFIPAVSAIGVFFVCSVLYLVLKNISVTAPFAYLSYLAALPLSCIVLTVLSFLWWHIPLQAISVSALIWSVGFCAERVLSLALPSAVDMKGIYFSCLLLQVINILVFLFVYFIKKSRRAE